MAGILGVNPTAAAACGRAPRRAFFTVFSGVSFFILALLAYSQLSTSAHPRAPRLDVEEHEPLPLRPESPAFTASGARESPTGDKYLIGVGRADITGPVVEINFAGYAAVGQTGSGLRQRLYSRAFIVADANKPEDRFVYLILDIQSGDTAVRFGILDGLAALGKEFAVYGQGNVAVTGTHSHSGPGGWFNYLLPQITSLGFDRQGYQAIVDGALLSIKRAHQSLTPGYLDFGTVNITDANLSRSLYAYLANPPAERAQYGDDDVDKALTLLRFQRASDGKNMGVLTWFPVHGTSMLENNTHVTGDNKGVAAYLFEKAVAGLPDTADGFVAGFSQANVGDTTPNVLGAYCDDGSGMVCSFENSTCGDGKSQSCHGRGPAFSALDLGVSSCYEIGRRQFAGAKALYDSMDGSLHPVVGSTVKSFHFYQDMSYYKFTLPDGTAAMTCPAALGYSFAAGTSDGPGAFDFTQADSGKPDANPVWSIVSNLLRAPSAQQKDCQQLKPILLNVGELSTPYAWTPNIVDMQMLRVGQFVIIVSPSEATTMSGRRWRKAVKLAMTPFLTDAEPMVVLGGPANTYAHYVATPEEYGIQRYEGASTLFGPHTLDAYINLTVSAAQYLAPGATTKPSPGPTPPDNRNASLSFITGVVQDNSPPGKPFGSLVTQPAGTVNRGQKVSATFVGANPRNNLRLEGTYAAVEMLNPDGKTWTQVRNDYDWSLVYSWARTNWLMGYSEVTVSWETGAGIEAQTAQPGTYRFKYYGDSKSLLGEVKAFEGTSNSFLLK